MHKEPLHIKKGFTLVEVIISSALILVLATVFTTAILYGQESAQIAGQRNRANLLAEEGIEAARNIRDSSFANLTVGTFGLSTTSNQWNLSGTSDTQDIFTRSITVSSIDSVTKQVTSTVTWPQNATRNGSVSTMAYLTNTQALKSQANCLVTNSSSSVIGGTSNTELRGITIQNQCAAAITISKITTSWTNTTNKIRGITINSTVVWSSTGPGTPTGTQNSGTQLTISAYVLGANSTIIPINRFYFTGSMTGNTFNIIFTMSDGTTKSVGPIQL